MKKSLVFNTAMVLALLACLAILPANGFTETWESLSKRMIESCTKYKQGLKDITWTMEMEVPSSEGAFKTTSTLYSRGKQFRVEVSMEGMEDAGMPAEMADMKTIVIGDDTNAWIVNPMMGKSKIPADEGAKYRGQWDCSDYLPVAAEIVGSEKIAGRDCYVLSVLDDSPDFAKLWIDQKSFVLMKLEGKPQEGVASVIVFSDYRKVSGDFEMPFRTEMYSGKDLISTTIVKSIAVNKGLADDLFDPDKIKASSGPDMKGMMEQMEKMKDKIEKVGDE
ncbi:MAG: outer membrane lipoprotein-sorting protein [Candidatus Krumholzibacteriia bacterium]